MPLYSDEVALEAAVEIMQMWGHDRSQFVSKIQVRVLEAMAVAYEQGKKDATLKPGAV